MLRTILVVIIFLIIIRASILSPFGALLGYLWFAFFRPQEWVWIDISQFHLSLVLACLLLFRCLSTNTYPNLKHPISIGIFAFLITGLVAQMNAINQAVGWEWVDYFSRLSLITLLMVNLINSERRFYIAVLTICSSLGFHTAKAGLASLIGGGVRFMDGLAGAFVDNNGYACAAVMIIPFLLAIATLVPGEWPYRKFITCGYYTAAPLTAYAVISTFSRAGLLALIVVTVMYILFNKRRIRLTVLMILFAVVVFPFVPLPEGYKHRVSTITTYEEENETSALSRLHFWRVAWNMAVDNPLGVGFFNFETNYDKYDFSNGEYGSKRAVHNSHLQVLTENGFLGFAVWGGMFLGSLLTCLRIRRRARSELDNARNIDFYEGMSAALIVSMFGFLAGGMFISMSLNDLTWITFGLVAALDRIYKFAVQAPLSAMESPLKTVNAV